MKIGHGVDSQVSRNPGLVSRQGGASLGNNGVGRSLAGHEYSQQRRAMVGHMHDVGLKLEAVVDVGNVAGVDRGAIPKVITQTVEAGLPRHDLAHTGGFIPT